MLKKIQIFTLTYEPYSGGVETHISEVYKRFAKEGWDITVLSSTFKNNLTFFRVNKTTYQGIKIIEYSPFLLKLYWLNIFWFLKLEDGEIVEFQNFLPLPGYFICTLLWFLKVVKKKHIHLVMSSHGWWEVKGETRILKLFQRINEIIGLPLLSFMVDAVKVVSESEKIFLSKYIAGEKIHIVNNGVSDEAFTYSKDLNPTNTYGEYFLHLSRLDSVKNIETSILALKFLPNSIRLLIAGGEFEKGYKNKLEVFIRNNNLIHRVGFIGLVSGREKYNLITNAIAHVHLSKWESFGISAVEAMSQGTINIIGKNLPMARIIEENKCGLLIDDIYDAKGLALLILSIKNLDQEELLKMRNSAKSVARRFTWGNVIKETESFYLKL